MKRMVVMILCGSAPVCTLMWSGCSGTTGREGLPIAAGPGGDATVPTLDGGAMGDANDASSSLYTGDFDVAIVYADRVLPDVQARPEAGEGTEAGNGLPNCPPFIPLGPDGGPTDIGSCVDEVPADWTSAGGVTLAAEGGVCATYPWMTTLAADNCLISLSPNGIGAPTSYPLLPPCNWAIDAGTATAGPGQTRSRYDICIELYKCLVRTRCFLSTVPDNTAITDCFCGVGVPSSDPRCFSSPQGPCVTEEMAALELSGAPASQAQVALQRFVSLGDDQPGWVGSFLNADFQQGLLPSPYGCRDTFSDAGAD